MALHIAKRAAGLSDALTLAINARFKALQAQGADAVSFGTGEPDFDTPEPIREAGIQAIRAGKTRYTPSSGIPELRKAIADRVRKDNGVAYDPSQILVTHGAKQALYQAMQVLCEEGDEILLPSPYWLSYPEMARAAGATPVTIPCDEADGWRLRADAVAKAGTSRARVLVLNSPNNPTGAVWSREDLAAVAEVCRRRDLAVISDEIYERMVYGGAVNTCFASLSDDARARTVTVSGVSKSYAMTGWRIGWAAAPKEVAAAMGNLQSHLTSNTPHICQDAAVAALTGDQAPTAAMVKEFEARRTAIVDALSAIEGASLVRPEGAFYVFLRVDSFYREGGIRGSMALCEALLEEEKVACIPGAAFGSDAHIRFSYATSLANIRKGCERVARFLSKLRK
jgi:aspartate aminotransferase